MFFRLPIPGLSAKSCCDMDKLPLEFPTFYEVIEVNGIESLTSGKLDEWQEPLFAIVVYGVDGNMKKFSYLLFGQELDSQFPSPTTKLILSKFPTLNFSPLINLYMVAKDRPVFWRISFAVIPLYKIFAGLPGLASGI